MFSNFLKTAFRHFSQRKMYAGLNVFGLAIGVTCLLLAFMYWKNERSFDDFHAKNHLENRL
jgi:putative ABC transport system permease protein